MSQFRTALDKNHRQAIIAADSANPEICDNRAFDLQDGDAATIFVDYTATGGTFAATLVPLWWDHTLEAYYEDHEQKIELDADSLSEAAKVLCFIGARAKRGFIKIAALSGDDAAISIHVRPVKERP